MSKKLDQIIQWMSDFKAKNSVNGVVLGLSRQYPYDVSYLVIASDNGVEFVLAGAFHQIVAVFFQRVVGGFGVVGGDTGISAHRC